MADIFSNMFFCNQPVIESPRSAAPPPPRRKSMGGQDLSEYLKAYRNKETVDQGWKKVHDKGRGKKRFKKLVNKQIMVSRMQNLGSEKRKNSSASSGLQSQRFKPRGSLHESFLFSDVEKRRLAEIARANEEKKKKREEYLKQNKGENYDRESLSSGQSRRRKKWKSKKDKHGVDDDDDNTSDGASIDLEASMRSLEIAFSKIREPIDEMHEESEDDNKSNKSVEEENEDDHEIKNEDDEEEAENRQAPDNESISSIENHMLEDEEIENENIDEHDSEDEDEKSEDDEEEEDEKNKAKSSVKAEKPNRGQDLIPPPSNLAIFTGKRRGSDRSTKSEGQSVSTPIKPAHRSPRSTRRVAPELTITPLRIRSVSRDRSPSVAKSKLLTPRASPSRFPVSPNKAPLKTPKKDSTTLRKKPLTLPRDPFTSRHARKTRVEQVKANPQANAVKRKGGAARSKLFDRSPSRSRLAVQKNTNNPQKSPAKRPLQKPSVKGRGGNADKKESGVPMQNYGTVKF